MLRNRMPRRLFSCLALLALAAPLAGFESQLQELADSVAGAIADRGKTRVAVVDFTDLQGRSSPLGSFLAEELSVALVSRAEGFEVVDRLQLQTLLGEYELSRAAVFERATTAKLLELTGVDALVTGRVTPSSTRLRLAVKILDTGTASLLGAASANLERDDFLDELWGEAPTLAAATAPSLAPPEAAPAPPAAAPVPQAPTPAAPTPVAVTAGPAAPPLPTPPPTAGSPAPPSIATTASGPAPAPAREAIREPVSISILSVEILDASVRVRLALQNNTASVLEWAEAGSSQLLDGREALLVCADCPQGVEADAELVAPGRRAEVDLEFAHDPRTAALEKRDAFAFFFQAGTNHAKAIEGPFTLTLEHEYRASGESEVRRSRVVFADLPAKPAAP